MPGCQRLLGPQVLRQHRRRGGEHESLHFFVQCQSYKLFNIAIIIIIITLISIFFIFIQVEVGLTSPVIQTLLEPFVDRLILKKRENEIC